MKGRTTWYAEALKDALKELIVINSISIPVSVAAGLYFSMSPLEAFGLILLLEAATLMLVGGAMDFANSSVSRGIPRIFRRTHGQDEKQGPGMERRHHSRVPDAPANYGGSKLQRAAIFTLTGVVLFAEAILLSVPFLR